MAPPQVSRLNILKWSLYLTAKNFLENEDLWTQPFNVYTEHDYKANANLADPFCFILDSQVTLQFTWLPIIIIETNHMVAKGFQLGGGTRFFEMVINVHYIDLTRTGRDDVASLWMENVRDIPLIDPTTGVTPVVDGAELTSYLLPIRDRSDELWIGQYERMSSDPKLFTGSSTNWSIMSSKVLMN